MLTKRKQSDQKGFTIIEVLIVLAIAGLILLIVFLAVPALQRNSRNTQRKNDVSGLLSAFSEYVDNNDGNLPSSCSSDCAFLANSKRGYYKDASQVKFVKAGSTGTNYVSDTENVALVSGLKCGTGGTTIDGTSRSVVALYMVETGGGGKQAQCVESGS